MEREWDRPLSIAMLALGGQGGGVLTKWLVDIAEAAGYLAQSTFVAGVAQRTGATVYCIEIFPQDRLPEDGRTPVFTPYPVPGDVDLVIAGELTEAGRAIQKGFVTPDVTTLVASTHRVYSIDEKVALGNGIVDTSPIIEAAGKVAASAVLFDMDAVATRCGAVISAVMLGAIAASGALPFGRSAFENAIRNDGRAVESNLKGFAAGFAGESQADEEGVPPQGIAARGPNGERLLQRIAEELPHPVHEVATIGALRALDYQDVAYASEYLDRVSNIAACDSSARDFILTQEVARLLALQMCYEDTIRVAQLKTAAERFERVREHLNVADSQPAYITEYFHPRFEEFCDTLPYRLGSRFRKSRRARRWLAPFFGRGRMVTTNKLGGFLLLSLLSRCKRWRRGTYRYAAQDKMIGAWLDNVQEIAEDDYAAALGAASCIEIVRGYGDTWERGYSRYIAIMDAADVAPAAQRAELIRRLREAALADEDGARFESELLQQRAA